MNASKPTRFVTYLRVSTARQGESGLGIDAQQAAVDAFAQHHGGVIVGQHIEIESGKRSDRPELAKALHAARKAKATLLVAKLDRLSRNVAFIAAVMDAGVDFIACDQPFASRLTLHILAAVAEDEAARISARTKAALAAAKARGQKLGSPVARETIAAARASLVAKAEARSAGTRQIVTDIKASGVETLTGIAAALSARGVKTPRGSAVWYPAQVARLVAAKRREWLACRSCARKDMRRGSGGGQRQPRG